MRHASAQYRYRIADTPAALAAGDQVLAERDTLRRAAIFDQRTQRFAGWSERARKKIDGRKDATNARFDDIEFDVADEDALPSVFGMRLGTCHEQIRPKSQRGNGRLQALVEMVHGCLRDQQKRVAVGKADFVARSGPIRIGRADAGVVHVYDGARLFEKLTDPCVRARIGS